tara:strand:+ start:5849 stop:6697 length:849 start_codon:yes stop_codon:yes gene_type:complete
MAEETAPVTAGDTNEAPTSTEDAVVTAPEDVGVPQPTPDTPEDRIEAILKKHEAEQNGEVVEEESLRDGESWDSIYKNQPDEVKRAMQSLRKNYTQKTQELSKQRKEAKEQHEKALALQKNLYESDAYKNLQSLADEAGEEFDPFDEASFKKYVEKAVAKRLQSVLEPMYKEQQKVQARQKLNNFMDEHQELKTDDKFKAEVKTVLVANENLTLEQAYWIVKGKAAKEQNNALTIKEENRRRAARAAGLKIANGKRAGITAPPNAKEMKAVELYEYLLSQRK